MTSYIIININARPQWFARLHDSPSEDYVIVLTLLMFWAKVSLSWEECTFWFQKDAVTFLSYLGIAIFFIGSHPIMPPCDLIKRLPYDRPWFTVGIIAGSFPSPVPWFCATSSTYFWSSILYHRESAGLKSTFPAATVTHLLNRRKTTIAIIHDMLINSGKLFQMVPGSQSYKCESLRLSP